MRCQPSTRRALRTAFTLIELLVVIALIVVIAGLGVLTIPLFQSQQKATQNGSQLVAWLAGAKARALSQQRATGIRLVQDPTDPNFIREIYYVSTPDDYAGGLGNLAGGRLYQPVDKNGSATTATTLYFTNVDFTGGLSDVTDWPVQPGDYLEINGGGLLYQIVGVQTQPVPASLPTSQNITVSRAASVGAEALDPTFTTYSQFFTTQWRIIRQPRRVQGEDSLTFNGNVAIDASLSQNVPARVVPTNPAQTYFEIVFAPNGGVVGRGTVGSDRIILWVRDSSKGSPFDNDPVLISIEVRTGFLGSYKVDPPPSADAYSYARDPRASGM